MKHNANMEDEVLIRSSTIIIKNLSTYRIMMVIYLFIMLVLEMNLVLLRC